jgi:hypothetical protein
VLSIGQNIGPIFHGQEPTGPETSARHYRCWLHNNPDWRSSENGNNNGFHNFMEVPKISLDLENWWKR